jgi:hypothetical protein
VRATPIALLCLAGCFGSRESDFAPGLEPLEEIRAPAPTSANGSLPEAFELVLGQHDDGTNWGHLRGYVHAPMIDVWEAYQQADVVVDRRRVHTFTPRLGVEEEYDYSMAIDTVVRDIITVEYTVTWRHGAVGDELDPEKVAIRWQKTHGSPLIDTLRGSIVLLPTRFNSITEVHSIEHLKAPRTSTDDVEGLLSDVWADLIAYVHGRSLQSFD